MKILKNWNLVSVWRWVVDCFRPAKAEPRKRRDTSAGKDAESAGRWYFKKDILDQLDYYFDIVKRVKRADPQTYKLWKRLGAVINPQGTLTDAKALPSYWNNPKTQPTFGAIAVVGADEAEEKGEDSVPMRFGAFRKYSKPPFWIESFDGSVYTVSVFYSLKDDAKCSHMIEFPIGVDSKGQCKVLKQITTRQQQLHHHDKYSRNGGYKSTLIHHCIDYSYLFDELRSDNAKARKMSTDELGFFFLSFIAHGWAGASAGLRVSAKRGPCVAAFGVDLLRTPYFFSDRQPVYAAAGHKKRIFHIVRTHERKRSDGSTTTIKSHFRGLRRFRWANSSVVISMPGHHHADLNEFTEGVIDDERFNEVNEETIPETQAAKRIGKRLRAAN